MKTCNKCKEPKELDKFGNDPRNADGKVGICNLCKQLANKALRERRVATNSYTSFSEKPCSQCGVTKTPDQFFRDVAMPDGKATVCKECKKKKTYAWREANKERYNQSMREYNKTIPAEKRYGCEIKRRYGCTLEQYNQMLVAQSGACSICKALHNPAEKKGRLYVDHCHTTGAIRSLLCGACNSMLGYAKDDSRILLEGVAYLARHKKESA